MKKNNQSEDNANELLEKLTRLVDSGKITDDQKKLLIEAIEGESYHEGDTIEIGLILNTEERDLIAHFLSEDIEITGTSDSQVSIIKGNQFVQVEKTDKSIKIQTKKDELGHFFHSHQGDLIKINIPSNMPVKIKTVSGDIVLKNLTGSIESKSVSGDIELKTCSGNITVSSISGDIDADKLKGCCTLISKSGDVELQDSEVAGTIKSYSGDLTVKDSVLSELDASSFSGDLQFRETELRGKIQLKTFSGDLDIGIHNEEGEFSGISGTGELTMIDQKGHSHPLQYEPLQIGQKGPKVLIKTSSGNARISLK